jgi:hypothetical protein
MTKNYKIAKELDKRLYDHYKETQPDINNLGDALMDGTGLKNTYVGLIQLLVQGTYSIYKEECHKGNHSKDEVSDAIKFLKTYEPLKDIRDNTIKLLTWAYL